MTPEEEIRKILDNARRRREQIEQQFKSEEEVGAAALEGAAVGATGAAVLGGYERMTRDDPARAALMRRVDPASGRPRARAAQVALGIVDDITNTYRRSPLAVTAAEISGGAGAGALTELAAQEGASPAAQMGAGVAGGIAGSVAPTSLANQITRFGRWGMEHAMPFLRGGAEIRAARQMQRRAGGPDGYRSQAAIDEAVANLDANTDPRITPARATGNQALMAQEARVMADHPDYAKRVMADLRAAVHAAEGDLRGLYGTPRGREDWERVVMERVSAPGTEIEPGLTDEMLDQAYKSFDALYEPIRGYPVRLESSRGTALATQLRNIAQTRTTIAGDDVRAQVARWLDNKYSGLLRRAKEGIVSSEDLLAFRSSLRAEARRLARTKPEAADLINLAADRVTDVMSWQLPKEEMRALRSADKQYSMYKIVENAVYSAGDRGLTPDHLLASIKRSAPSSSSFARGSYADMRRLAHSGRRIDEVVNRPDLARRMVKDLSEEDAKLVRADFVDYLMRKSNSIDPDTGEDVINGIRLQALLNKNIPTARALGMTHEEIGRIDRIASSIRSAQQSSPAAVARLIEDGPSDVMQLMATLVGAKQGQRIAGGGMGSSIVLAGHFARAMRDRLARLTSGKATEILTAAHSDPALYRALLVKPTDPIQKQIAAARTLNAWLAVPVSAPLEEAYDSLMDDADALGAGE